MPMPWTDAIHGDPHRRRWPTLVNVMLSRQLLLVLVLLFLAVLLPRNSYAAYAFIGFAFVTTISYAVWLRRGTQAEAGMPIQFMVDVMVITGLVHFTGGIRSEMSLFYPLVILAAGIIVSGRHAILVALFSILLYAAVVLLEMEGILGYYGAGSFPYEDVSKTVRELMLRTLIFCFFAAASGFITDRCFLQNKQLGRLKGLGQLLFDNVRAPLLGVRRDGRVVLANAAARERLAGAGGPDQQMPLFGRILPVPLEELAAAGRSNRLRQMRTLDGVAFPALVEVELAHFPMITDVLPLLDSGETELFLVLFQDMTGVLQTEQASREMDRLSAAAGVVAEMAHEMRNPLTAIRGAGELLSETAGAAAKQRRTMTASDWTVIDALCAVISQETSRLDHQVQNFMEAAEHDPGKLADIRKSADEWQARVPIYGGGGHEPDSSR